MENKITKDHISQAQKPDGEQGYETLNRMNKSHEEMTNWALDYLPEIEPKATLDIGCGGGATIARLAKKYPQTKVYGIDYSETSVELSQKFNEKIECEIVQGDVKKLPYNNEQFDLITAFETVYFWGELEVAFQEVRRCLKKDGLFLVCCEMSDNKNPRWENVLDEMHIMGVNEWDKILTENSFEILSKYAGNDEWICLICRNSL